MNRITETSPRWYFRNFVFLILLYAFSPFPQANAWQVSPQNSLIHTETTPLILYGSETIARTPDDVSNEVSIASAPVSISLAKCEESTQPVLQITRPPQLPGISVNQPGSTDSTFDIDEGFANDPLSQELAETNKRSFYEPDFPFLGQDGILYLKQNFEIEKRNSPGTSVFSRYVGLIGIRNELLDVDQYPIEPFAFEPIGILPTDGTYADGYPFMGDYGTPVVRRSNRRDLGVGPERLPFALSNIPASQPFNNIRIRSDFEYGWQFPNRAEYLWAAPPKGPKTPEIGLDLQEYSILMEMGSETFSFGTELPLIWLNPTINPNTSGFGDMSVTTKLVLVKGQSLQLTQITRTHIPTGQASSGRGSGHFAMEPGLIGSYTRDEGTMFHGMITLLFPIGGDPNFSGEVLEYSFGVARVWYDSDQFAIIPTLESLNWAVLAGAKGIEENKISGDYISNLHPGVRFVFDRGGDLGLFEAGFSTGLSLTDNHFYESLIRFDLRWSY